MGNKASTPKVHTEAGASNAGKLVLDVIHFNDVYNIAPQFEDEPIGGATRFMTVLEELKKEIEASGRKALVLFSGDFVGPSLMSTVSQGAHLIDTFNVLGVDYATFGNHEFDFGYKSLVNRLHGIDDDVQDDSIPFEDYPASKVKWIATNMTETATGLPVGGKDTAKTVLVDWGGSNGVKVKVGLIGISENWLSKLSQLKPNELSYEDFIESARKHSRALKEQGADIVLALTHNRLDNDYKLTEAVPEIDLLLGGHDHFYRRDRNKRVVKGGEEFRWLNYLQIEIPAERSGKSGNSSGISAKAANESGRIIVHTERYDVYSDIPEHPTMASVAAKYDKLAELKYGRVLAHTKFEVDCTEEFVRFKESMAANWFADICAEDYSEKEGTQEAEIIMLNGYVFGAKKGVPAGKFSLGDLFSCMPRASGIVVMKLSGSDVVRTLTRGAKALPGESGGINHVNKRLAYTVVLPKMRSARPTVTNVLFDGKPIEMDRMYSVGMSEGMASGNFGFPWLGPTAAERIVDEESASLIQDIFIMFCKRHELHHAKNIVDSPSIGRISIIDEA